MNTIRQMSIGVTLLLGIVTASTFAGAIEPTDNTAPFGFFSGNATLYQRERSGSAGWQNFESISPSGDIDYLVLSCPAGKVSSVSIELNSGAGDLDIKAYDLNGVYLGSSAGVGT
ncbi:MAG TPA: hypothetical protein VIV60_08135, partial [Polyangiaceae bacterium]